MLQPTLCLPELLRTLSLPMKREAALVACSLKVYVPGRGIHSWPWNLHNQVSSFNTPVYNCTCLPYLAAVHVLGRP